MAVILYGMQLWDVRSGVRLAVLQPRTGDVESLALAPNGRTIAIGAQGEVTFWEPKTHVTLSRISVDEIRSMRLAYSPKGELLAIAGEDGIIKIWDLAGQRELISLRDETPYDIFNLVFSPDGALVAAAGSSCVINLWNVTTGRKVATLTGHEQYMLSLSFSPDGRCLASGSQDGRLKLWDLATKQELYTLLYHPRRAVCSVVFHPNGHQLFATTGFPGGGEVHVWTVTPPVSPAID